MATKGYAHEDYEGFLALADSGSEKVGIQFDGGEITTLTVAQVKCITQVMGRASAYASKTPAGEQKTVVIHKRAARGSKSEK